MYEQGIALMIWIILIYLFISLGLPVLGRVTATACGITTWALNRLSPNGRQTTTLGSPTLFKPWVSSLTTHKIYICKGCEMGPTVYRPYLRGLERLTVCRCIYSSTFFSVILRHWVLVWLEFKPMASRSNGRCLSNWANWAEYSFALH